MAQTPGLSLSLQVQVKAEQEQAAPEKTLGHCNWFSWPQLPLIQCETLGSEVMDVAL